MHVGNMILHSHMFYVYTLSSLQSSNNVWFSAPFDSCLHICIHRMMSTLEPIIRNDLKPL